MRRIVRAAAALAVLLAASLLSGCWDRIEVNDLAIVHGVALDRSPEGEVELTVSMAVPAQIKPPGAPGGEGQGPPATNKSATGRTVSEAQTRLQKMLSRQLFWAQNAVILIGEDLAREGVADVLDFFTRSTQPRLNTVLAVAVGRAKDVLATTLPIELNVPSGIQEIERLRIGPFITLRRFLTLLLNEGVEPFVGLVHVTTTGAPEPGSIGSPQPVSSAREGPTQPSMRGAAVFKGPRLVALLTEEETPGLHWAQGDFAIQTVEVPMGDGKWVGFNVIHQSRRLVPAVKDGEITMRLEVKAETALVDNQASVDADDVAVVRLLEEKLASEIERSVRHTLDKVQREAQSDILGFGAAVRRAMPAVWEQVKASWDELFPEIPVEVVVDARILRTGLTSRSLTVPRSRATSLRELREAGGREGPAR